MRYKIINQLRPLALPLLVASLSIHCSCGKKPTHASGSGDHDGSIYDRLNNGLDGIKQGVNDLANSVLFFVAVETGRVDKVREFLSNGMDVNIRFGKDDKGDTALYIATEKGNIPMMQALLQDPKINVALTNKSNQTPLDIAFEKDNPAAVRLLLQAANIDPKTIGPLGDNIFHKAIESNKKAVADALLAADSALVNIANNKGESPLHLAFSNDNKNLSEALLNRGANVNAADKYGKTPLYSLIDSGSPVNMDMLESLLDKGADVDKKDNNSRTPLHMLLSSGKVDPSEFQIVKKLLNKAKDINIQDATGNTPLHRAVQNLHKPAVEALLQDGRINTKIISTEGDTPIAIAEKIATESNKERKNKAIEIRDLLLIHK